jgi:ribonuclease HIII
MGLMATKSVQLSAEAFNALIQKHQAHFEALDHPTIVGHIRLSDTTITLYKSLKAVYQNPDPTPKKNPLTPSTFTPHAGSDEVGTGDTFGPVVVVACVVNQTQYEALRDKPILDSKAMDDATILTLGPELLKQLSHSKLILNNHDYNRIHPTNNLNQIKAKLHNQAYLHLSKHTSMPTLCVIDQFTPEETYYKYLRNESEVVKSLSFHTKAESQFFAVACASILARYLFLKHWEAMEAQFGMRFPKGSGAPVEQALHDFVSRHGRAKLSEVAKLNFKNIEKTLGSLT